MQLFLECGKANAYSANIEFNVSAHGEHICENAYSANIEFNVSAHGEHIRERKAPTENSNKSTQRKKTQKKTRTVSYLPVMCSVVLSSHWHLEPRLSEALILTEWNFKLGVQNFTLSMCYVARIF